MFLKTLEALLALGMAGQRERAMRWLNASHHVSGISGYSIFIADIQQLGRLDCLINELESAQANSIQKGLSHNDPMVTDFCSILARSWLSLTYETLRSIKQRLLSDSEKRVHWSNGIDAAFSSIERVRVAELKREIAGGGKLKTTGQLVELYAPGEMETTREEYIHGQTALNLLSIVRPADGSLGWHAYNVAQGQTEELYRRDMAECVLLELEKL